MKKQITSISLVQTAKVAAACYFVLGLVGSVFLLISALFTSGSRVSGIAMAIFAPLVYAFLGFVFVFVGAWVYNQVAKRTGGFEFTVTEVRGEF